MPINIGIIGCGTIAQLRHAPEYAANSDCCLTGLFDPVFIRAKELSEKYHARIYNSYEELLYDKRIDAISVCTSNATHALIATTALHAKKHVLCEKPMATDLHEAEAMIAAAKKNNCILMIGQNQRFITAHKKAKEFLTKTNIGKVLFFRTSFMHKGPETWSAEKGRSTWFFRKDAAQFGSLGDLGVHKLDLIEWLLDDRIEAVMSDFSTLDKKYENGESIDVEDYAVVLLKMKEGARGILSAAWCNYGSEDNSTVIYCTNGVIKIFTDSKADIILEWRDGRIELFDCGGIGTNNTQINSGVIDSFIKAIKDNQEPPVTGEDGYRLLRELIACEKSAETKSWIDMNNMK